LLLSLLVLLYRKQYYDFETYSDLCPSIRTSSSVLQHPYHLRPTPPVTKKAEGEKASTVVFAVKGSKMAEKVLKGGLRAAGVKYGVERFINAGPDSFCGICSRWGHVKAKCGSSKMPACMLCAG